MPVNHGKSASGAGLGILLLGGLYFLARGRLGSEGDGAGGSGGGGGSYVDDSSKNDDTTHAGTPVSNPVVSEGQGFAAPSSGGGYALDIDGAPYNASQPWSPDPYAISSDPRYVQPPAPGEGTYTTGRILQGVDTAAQVPGGREQIQPGTFRTTYPVSTPQRGLSAAERRAEQRSEAAYGPAFTLQADSLSFLGKRPTGRAAAPVSPTWGDRVGGTVERATTSAAKGTGYGLAFAGSAAVGLAAGAVEGAVGFPGAVIQRGSEAQIGAARYFGGPKEAQATRAFQKNADIGRRLQPQFPATNNLGFEVGRVIPRTVLRLFV